MYTIWIAIWLKTNIYYSCSFRSVKLKYFKRKNIYRDLIQLMHTVTWSWRQQQICWRGTHKDYDDMVMIQMKQAPHSDAQTLSVLPCTLSTYALRTWAKWILLTPFQQHFQTLQHQWKHLRHVLNCVQWVWNVTKVAKMYQNEFIGTILWCRYSRPFTNK